MKVTKESAIEVGGRTTTMLWLDGDIPNGAFKYAFIGESRYEAFPTMGMNWRTIDVRGGGEFVGKEIRFE